MCASMCTGSAWLQASARLVSTDEDGEAFWLSEGQEDVLAHEYGASASPLYLNGSAQLLVEGFQKYGRLQVRTHAQTMARCHA